MMEIYSLRISPRNLEKKREKKIVGTDSKYEFIGMRRCSELKFLKPQIQKSNYRVKAEYQPSLEG